MHKNKKAALGFIFITLLLDVTGLGIIIPVLPTLISELIQGNLSQAASYGGWLTFSYAFMQFICAPLIGNLSDKYGRRPVLLLSLLGFGIDYLFLAFAPSIGWLFVGRIIAGITGASFTTASAYIADVSTAENRAQNFGLIGAAFGLGFILGPVIGGLLGQFGSRIPFFAAAGISLLNTLYGYFVLPESLPINARREFDIKRANPLGSLFALKKYPAVSGLIVTLILIYTANNGLQSIWSYYGMEKFSWNEAWVGYSLGFIGLMVGIVQAGITRWAIPKFGQEKSLYIGLCLYSLGLLLFAFAPNGIFMFIFIVPYSLGGIANPALQSIISSYATSSEQGELQGALTSLMSATTIFAPPLMTSIFSYFTDKNAPLIFPGAPFLLCSVLVLVSVLLANRSLTLHHVKK
ncbi:tetracycline resistance MFS efflux pump [Pelobium manganitolerans]|uniref:Tetracycline resistance MFS efflux pump n=1 Tax=Pelobium manganitolerans TaxID=1842495 RepID=A0A419S437_9SPHI|nr:TCR/Tet family MFS transporter [Pelobium manganitolerans]RKD14411.1 tetracycline resistance MFS efflux pump [Pelobium manganitolerans]